MESIILNDGSNSYKLPHLRKDARLRQGQLPLSIAVTEELKAKIDSINAPIVAAEVVAAIEEALEEEEEVVVAVEE